MENNGRMLCPVSVKPDPAGFRSLFAVEPTQAYSFSIDLGPWLLTCDARDIRWGLDEDDFIGGLLTIYAETVDNRIGDVQWSRSEVEQGFCDLLIPDGRPLAQLDDQDIEQARQACRFREHLPELQETFDIQTVIAARGATPENEGLTRFLTTRVSVTPETFPEGVHFDKADALAAAQGYESAMVFDEVDGEDWLFRQAANGVMPTPDRRVRLQRLREGLEPVPAPVSGPRP